jgi:hypothetical protein
MRLLGLLHGGLLLLLLHVGLLLHHRRRRYKLHPPVNVRDGDEAPAVPTPVLDVVAHAHDVRDGGQAYAEQEAEDRCETAGFPASAL